MPPIVRISGPVGGSGPPPPFAATLVGLAPTPLEIGADLVNPTFNAFYAPGAPTTADLTDSDGFPLQNVVASINPITRPNTYTHNPIGATAVFTLTADNGGPVSVSNVTYTWLPRVFFGLSLNPGPFTEAEIEALAGSALASVYQRVFTVAPVAQYVVYAFPAAFGNPGLLDWQIGPFPGGFIQAADVLVTANTPGAPANLYHVWRSFNLLTGTPNVTVTLS
jgi:hypothetical protein